MNDIGQFFKAIAGRTEGGIVPASAYVKGMVDCVGDGECLKKFPGLAGADFDRLVKETSEVAAWTTPDQVAVHFVDAKGVRAADGKTAVPAEAAAQTLTPGACADITCVVTTDAKDRDGDILRTKGADPDPRMPVLWQHLPPLPIGKWLGTVEHTDNRLVARASLIDSAMGRDAAQFLEFGALRFSHGFKPKAYKPLDPKAFDQAVRNGTHYHGGFDVTEYGIVELSTVSVPANTDAILTSLHRGKIESDFVKAMARGIDAKRPLVVSVPGPVPGSTKDAACGCDAGVNKNTSAPVKGGLNGPMPVMLPPLKGSWEEVSSALESSARDYLDDSGIKYDDWNDMWLVGTFDNYGIVSEVSWSGVAKNSWQISWEKGEGGPKWTGVPVSVSLSADISKAVEALVAKRLGRSFSKAAAAPPTPAAAKGKISQRNLGKIEECKTLVNGVAGATGIEVAHKASLEKAVRLLDDVITDVTPGPDDAETAATDAKAVSAIARRLYAAVAANGPDGLADAEAAHRELGTLVGCVRQWREQAGLAELATALKAR